MIPHQAVARACSVAVDVAYSLPSRSWIRPARGWRCTAMPTWFGRSLGHAAYSSRRVLPVARARTRSPRPKLRALGSPPADLLVAALGGRPRRGVFCRHRAIDDKWQAPLADALVADDDPTRRQDQ